VRILEKMTELELGVAAAFSILVVVIVFAVIGAISLFLRLFRQPGAPDMANILGG
jgi:iron(III) transport system permease protein